jgi:hypothetical protein
LHTAWSLQKVQFIYKKEKNVLAMF